MARYSIEDTTLTALGDAIRDKSGKSTKIITVMEEKEVDAMKVSKTSNATGFDSHDGKTQSTDSLDVITFQGASGIKVDIAYQTFEVFQYVQIATGAYTDIYKIPTGTTKYYTKSVNSVVSRERKELIFENTDTITIYWCSASSSVDYLGYYAECYALDADGNVISGGTALVPVEKEVPNTMTPLQMASEIRESLDKGLPQEAFTITGNCQYRFANGGWDWFIENYGDRVTTKDTESCNYMFAESKVSKIPFDINGRMIVGHTGTMSNMFYNCKALENPPKMILKPTAMNYLFRSCYRLREIPEEVAINIDGSYLANLTSGYGGDTSHMFNGCYSLRKYPNSLLKLNNPVIISTYSTYNSLFNDCYALDEIVDLPVVHRSAKWTGGSFNSTFEDCYRLKRLTFETNEDGSPIKIDGWSKQTIDLSKNVGCAPSSYTNNITDYNSGITTAKSIYNDETYQALKDDADWFTSKVEYSRYNKASAVETINTLPDLSGGAGGNTIKFTGAAGSATDGGAINTLTAEEIAIATAKGWTVSLV